MKITRRQLIAGLGVSGVAAAFPLTSCAAKSQTFVLGMVEFPGYAPWYLAHSKSLFGNTDVRLSRIASIGDIRAAFRTGKIDGYVATFDIFQDIEGQLPPGRLVLPLVSSNGGDGVVVANGIKNVSDLKGKTVIGERGLPPIFILEYLLNKQGLKLSDVSFRDIPSNDVPATFLTGHFAAAGTYQPLLDRIVQQRPDSRILATSKDTPRLITDFLITSDKMLESRMNTLVDVAKGWFNAVRYLHANPDDAMTLMAAAFSIKTDEMRGYSSEVSWLSREQSLDLMDRTHPLNAYALFDEVGQVLRQNDSRIQLLNSSQAIDMRLIERLGS
jgi:NitT/TauT family transport system substrate-binding protein